MRVCITAHVQGLIKYPLHDLLAKCSRETLIKKFYKYCQITGHYRP